jgi:hypothetical protein
MFLVPAIALEGGVVGPGYRAEDEGAAGAAAGREGQVLQEVRHALEAGEGPPLQRVRTVHIQDGSSLSVD